jgi:release factor glutamine methyltransferase
VIASPAGRTLREVLLDTESALAKSDVDESPLEARLLVQDVTGHSWAYLLAHPNLTLDRAEEQRLASLVDRRSRREPFAYVVSHADFRGLRLRVDPRVLVPRPETELLAGLAIDRCDRGDVVVDVGTGSGAIALSVAAERPELTVVATDISAEALSVAAANRRDLGLDQRVALVRCDLLGALTPGRYTILANLPYVPADELASAQPELGWEPQLALAGGPDGLDVYRRFLREAMRVARQGMVAFEIGAGQSRAACELASNAFPGATINVLPDFGGIERVVVVEL